MQTLTTTLLLLAATACGAARNPLPSDDPADWMPAPAEKGASASPAPATAKATPAAATGNAGGADAKTSGPAANGNTASPQAGASGSPPERTAPAPTGVVIANVAGKPIDVRELITQWVHHRSAEALEELDHLVLTRLVAAEAGRLGLVPPPDRVEKAYADAVAAAEKEIHKRYPGVALDAWVDQKLGLDPLAYRERMRNDALNQLLAERVTRTFFLQTEHTLLRVIVVKSETDVRAVQEALAKGEAFEDVARRLSVDEASAKLGGRVPPVLRSDTDMSKIAFETTVGQVSEPRYSKGAWLIAKIEARPPAREGDWNVLGEAVELSLAERGIEELEFSQWRTAMLRQYQVDIAPFLRLSGQPSR